MVELNDNQTQSIEGEIEDQQNNTQGGEVKPTNSEQAEAMKQLIPKTIRLEDLEEEKEYSSDEFEELNKLYEDTISDYVEGELVVGKILSIGDKDVTVDIGFKSEGTIPIEEFSHPEELNIGADLEVFIDNIEDSEGRLVLSKKKVDFIHSWEKVLNSHDRGEILQGRCIRRIKGGIVVDLGGVDAFLPGSQIDVKPIRDFDAFIGQTMDFKVVKVNNLRKNIVVSHRVLVEEEMREQREKILENLEKNQVLEGNVKNITDFGVFIDLGGVDGLLHINDLSWGRVSHPSEIVALDETIKVMVLDFNEEKDRISLGLKQLQPHPWENVPEKYPVGAVVKGKVVNISDYGAFVELEKGVEGLIHISEMSWTQHIKHPSKILAVGEIVEAKILNVDEEEKKISLGLKQLEPDPWDTLEEKYPIGSRHEGKVRNLTNFGAFVELEEGIDGLIHISDLSWTKKVRHPGEVVKKSDTIEVVVLNVDRENRRISLGYKQTTENPWDNFEEIYKPGAITKGKIVRLIEKGVIAELPEVVDGFVPMSHLVKPNITKPSDGYKVGDELELCVIEFNKDAKKIVLSEKIDHALSLVRQKEQGKEVEIEEPEELFAEPTEDMKIGKQPLAEAEKEDKVEQVAKDEKTTEEAKSEISAEEIKVEASAEEAKHEVSAEEIKVEAPAEEAKHEVSAEEIKVEAPAEEAKHEVSSEAAKAEFKTEEIEPKSDAEQIMDESTNEETKAGKIEGEEKADPVVEASATETESEQASVEKDKSSEATKKKTTKRRASTKKKEENTGDAK
jgi:small subunit ribosomal protein S1